LNQQWQQELDAMATRVKSLREGLLSEIQKQGIDQDFSFITRQKGMFTYLGISKEQVAQMRKDFSIYMADSSRINVAGLNTHCLEYVAKALKAVC
ncbi:MAG: aminotransferase class I/II-fold pyridoxal phosphate-dependent enzyme, partial [Gammaproteobacteria bacterium]|nr:aminotransferase class I/II-fold pyridoxal phosphate-dependent enzyme [Gammaproteobacteria bacterium]